MNGYNSLRNAYSSLQRDYAKLDNNHQQLEFENGKLRIVMEDAQIEIQNLVLENDILYEYVMTLIKESKSQRQQIRHLRDKLRNICDIVISI